VAVALAAPVGAAVDPKIKNKIAKQESGPYSDGVRVNLTNGGPAKFAYLKVKSETGSNEPASLRVLELPLNSFVKYYKDDGTNISDEVASVDGYEFTAKPDKAKRFRVKVKQVGPTLDACVLIRVFDDLDVAALALLGLNSDPSDC
jgi:hypothetical protein